MNINIDLGNGTVSGGGGTGSDGITPHIGANGNWFIGDEDTGVSAQGPAGADGATGTAGSDGDDGVGIVSIERTAGDGSAGTTDTYTITMTDGSTEEFTVYNGADGGTDSDHMAAVGLYLGDLDTATATSFVVRTNSTENAELWVALGSYAANTFTHVFQGAFFQSVSNTAPRTQIAVARNGRMASRTYNNTSNSWGAWAGQATTDYAVNKAGDTMTGNLVISKSTPIISLNNTSTGTDARVFAANNRVYLQAANVYGDDTNRRQLQLMDSTAQSSIASAFKLYDIVGGTSKDYNILHTGNKDLIYTYGTDDIEAGSASPYETGHLHFVIE